MNIENTTSTAAATASQIHHGTFRLFMLREELDIHQPCAACGALVAEGLSPIHEFGEDGVLCWDCALARGGRHDPEQDRWLVPPDTNDLTQTKESA